MTSLFLFGFLVGMRHALEADHIAAIATLSINTFSRVDALKQGAAWGIGHTIALLSFSLALFSLDKALSFEIARYLEAAVGVLLIALGADVIRKMISNYQQFKSRVAAASLVTPTRPTTLATSPQCHQANHRPVRALLVGLMHGMAGSAALSAIAINSVGSLWIGLLYILMVGLGSMAGMAVLSMLIALPLRAAASFKTDRLQVFHGLLQTSVGLFSVGLGSVILQRTL